MLLLWILLGLVGAFMLLVVVLHLLGKRLPEGHVISATLRLARTPEEVFAVLVDTSAIPSWDPGVTRVERLPDREGKETWRWTMGRNRMVLTTTRSEPPRTLARAIADEAKFFSGTWTYEISREGSGCAVLLTEHGRVHVAIPRAAMHYLSFLADPSMYLKRHLTRLADRFGESPRIEVGARAFRP
jgi:uncharacterized protein YndB with AHSA1/START domain